MNILVKEKDESITYNEITEVLHASHKTTHDAGLIFRASYQSAAETEKRVMPSGKFYVAFEQDEIIGVIAFKAVKNKIRWIEKTDIAQVEMLAVLEQYRGKGVSKKLLDTCEKYAFKKYELILADTAAKNISAVKLYIRNGYVPINYVSHIGTNYYSIVLAKWKQEEKCPRIKCKLYFFIKKLVCVVKYKKDGNKRWIFGK